MSSVIKACALQKSFHQGKIHVDVLKRASITVEKGQRIAIIGPSGSGKSTLLHLLGGLEKPSSGSLSISDQDFFALPESKRCQLRNKTLGFIYQFHHLLPEFTVLENTCMPMLLGDVSITQAKKKATCLLEQVGLSHRLEHKVAELSGGERQRVAIARAISNSPDCILADEPTGNLDEETAKQVFDVLLRLNKEHGMSLVMVTHDLALAKQMDTQFTIHQGELIQS